MIDKFRNIFKKLNKLNSDIVFFYYSKYRNDKYAIKYFPSDFSNIDLDGFYNSGDMTSKSERCMLLKTKFPYYYKMINLYAHLTSIVEYNSGEMGITYNTVHDNFIINGDIPQDIIEQMLSNFQEYTFALLTVKEIEVKNKELRILMKNANSLNSNFKKYGKDEDEFCRNSSFNDYEYLVKVADAEKERENLQRTIEDMEKKFELEQLEAQQLTIQQLAAQQLETQQKTEAARVASQMMGQNQNVSSHGIIPSSTTSFITLPDELMKDELNYLLTLRDADIISEQTYYDRVNVVILKYNKKSYFRPVQSPNPIINNTGLYDNILKMNPIVDDDFVKKIIEESECKKDAI